MSDRYLTAVCAVIAVVVLTPAFAAAQSTNTTPPQTPSGQPDLQGIWDFRSITPLERPEDLSDKAFLTKDEAATLEQEAVDRDIRLWSRPARRTEAGGGVGAYNNFWFLSEIGAALAGFHG